MRATISCSFVLSLACLATALAAQEAEPEIVVEGSREEVRHQIKELLSDDGDQIARFETSYCPRVIGFDDEYGPIVERLVRENAIALGVDVEPEGCTPTASIIFTEDPLAVVEGLRTRMPGLFDGMTPAQVDTIVSKERSFYAWRGSAWRDRNGRTLPEVTSIEIPLGGGGSVKLPADASLNRQSSAGRLATNWQRQILASFLVMDIDSTPGMTLRQIADFATLHTLLEISDDAHEKAPANSILRLFDTDDPAKLPGSMGSFESKLLSEFYALENTNTKSNRMRGRLAEAMQKHDPEPVE